MDECSCTSFFCGDWQALFQETSDNDVLYYEYWQSLVVWWKKTTHTHILFACCQLIISEFSILHLMAYTGWPVQAGFPFGWPWVEVKIKPHIKNIAGINTPFPIWCFQEFHMECGAKEQSHWRCVPPRDPGKAKDCMWVYAYMLCIHIFIYTHVYL